MSSLFDDYVARADVEKMLREAKTKKERNMLLCGVNINNCLARFRGWHTDEDREKIFDALKNDKLFFSTALGYNDPFDTLMYVNYDKLFCEIVGSWHNMDSYVSKLKEKSPFHGAFVERYWASSHAEITREEFLNSVKEKVAKIKKSIHSNIKGICLSENKFSVPMWAHYANNHTGIALWYDKRDLTEAKCFDASDERLERKFALKHICYQEKRVDATEFVNAYLLNGYRYQKGFGQFMVGTDWPIVSHRTLKDIILTKDVSWSYEQEVRLIPRSLEFEQENSISYLKIKPRAIVLGAKISQQDENEVINIAKELKDISVYKALLDETEELYIVKLDEDFVL